MDLDKGPTHYAINQDERISPKATLLRRAVQEQQYRWGLSQQQSGAHGLLCPLQRAPSHRVSARRAEPGASNRVHGQTGQGISQYWGPAGVSNQEWQETRLGTSTLTA